MNLNATVDERFDAAWRATCGRSAVWTNGRLIVAGALALGA